MQDRFASLLCLHYPLPIHQVHVMLILLNHRPVLSAALATGLTAGCLAAPWLAASSALLVAWCAAAAVHLALSLRR